MKYYYYLIFIVGSFFSFQTAFLFAEVLNQNEPPVFQEDPYLAFAEVMPQPVGGLEAIYKKITYPEIALKGGLEGKVYLLVYINENGGVDDVKIIKGIGGGCDEAATNAVKDVKYTPAKNKGVSVKIKLSLSIVFKLHK